MFDQGLVRLPHLRRWAAPSALEAEFRALLVAGGLLPPGDVAEPADLDGCTCWTDLAAEEPARYDGAGGHGSEPDEPCEADEDQAVLERDAAPAAWRSLAALGRLGATPGSEAAAAITKIAEGLQELAAVEVGEEHVEVVGDAAVAVQLLRNQLDGSLVDLLGAFDAAGGHLQDGAVSCASWFRVRTNVDGGTATGLVQMASRLGDLPLLHGHLRAGHVTLPHVLAITRAAIPERAAVIAANEATLTALALCRPPSEVRTAIALIRDHADEDGSEPRPEPVDPSGLDPRRELTFLPGLDGLTEVRGTLDSLTWERLRVVLESFHVLDPPDTPADQRRSPAQRRHDALHAFLGKALSIPDLPSVQDDRPRVVAFFDLSAPLEAMLAAGMDPRDLLDAAGVDTATLADMVEQDHASATAAAASGGGSAGSGGGSVVWPRPQGPISQVPPGRFASGEEVPAAAARALLAEATLTTVLTLGPWRVVNVGRTQRVLPGWLRTVLHAMQQNCRGPDCDRPAAWTEAHHEQAFGEGGDTDLNMTIPLCSAHHDLPSTKGWGVTMDRVTGVATWASPDGRTFHVAPSRR